MDQTSKNATTKQKQKQAYNLSDPVIKPGSTGTEA